MLRRTMMAVVVASVFTVGAAPASAQVYDDRTTFTFSAPVGIPGATLPAGSYIFRLADPGSGRRVVQVLSEDGKTVYGMFFTTTATRADVSTVPDVRLQEAPIGSAPAIQTWWLPGTTAGREFLYPASRTSRLAGLTAPAGDARVTGSGRVTE